MRQSILILLLFAGLTLTGNSQVLYELNSCKIDFVFATGNWLKGIKTVIFTDSGRTEKEFSVTYRDTSSNLDIPTGLIGNRTVYRELLIHTNDSVFSIDLDRRVGTKKQAFGIRLISSMYDQMKRIREDSFLNKKCDVMDLGGVKLWIWKGIVLKKELSIEGVYEYATSIDENYIISKSEFLVPKEIKMH